MSSTALLSTVVLSVIGAGGLGTIVVAKLFDIKLERLRVEKEVTIAEIEADAATVQAAGFEAIKTIIELNRILKEEVIRLKTELEECRGRR